MAILLGLRGVKALILREKREFSTRKKGLQHEKKGTSLREKRECFLLAINTYFTRKKGLQHEKKGTSLREKRDFFVENIEIQ